MMLPSSLQGAATAGVGLRGVRLTTADGDEAARFCWLMPPWSAAVVSLESRSALWRGWIEWTCRLVAPWGFVPRASGE